MEVRIWAGNRDVTAKLSGAGPDPSVALSRPTPALLPGDHGPIVVGRCAECLDERCGYEVADVRRDGGTVTWTVWRRHHDEDGWRDNEPHMSLAFDAEQYVAEVERAAREFSP